MEKDKKRVMYVGFKGDRGSPFNAHGLRFESRKVYPVSENVWKWARWQKGFVEVEGVTNIELDWPKTEFKSDWVGSIANVQI